MTMTAETPTVNGTRPAPTPKLNAALARFQAELPKVTKDESANTGSYKYDYAGLDAVSDAALPLLGKNGLAFSAWPTLIDGKFVLQYELLHESGEQKTGIFPLVSSGKPQDLGGLLTYYRRYALQAVTGIAPGGEDNDAQTANHPQQYDTPRSAAEAFENASPRPAADGNGQAANGTAVRPAQAARPVPQPEGDVDEDAQVIADEVHQTLTVDALKALNTKAMETRKMAALIRNPATGGTGGLGQYINWRKSLLERADKALIELKRAAGTAGLDDAEMEHRLVAACGHNLEEASAEEMTRAAGLILKGAGVGTGAAA